VVRGPPKSASAVPLNWQLGRGGPRIVDPADPRVIRRTSGADINSSLNECRPIAPAQAGYVTPLGPVGPAIAANTETFLMGGKAGGTWK
jgi:hypothetical protein